MRAHHPDLVLATLALLSVGALHALAHASEPPLVSVADAPHREGARVALEARILAARHGAFGRALTLVEDGARIDALGPRGAGPAPGDEVRIVGVVTRLERSIGISFESVAVLREAAARIRAPGELARAPQDYDGARVVVRGETRADWLVGDDARIRLAGDAPPSPSGWWIASGTFRYHARDASYVLDVDAWTRS